MKRELLVFDLCCAIKMKNDESVWFFFLSSLLLIFVFSF